ncbi:tRNA (adenosine(37)-N6)-dimethylallyltransferase MiaA [Konateibacter massiliensis]|uniref:tRNA (adenosine(37)-N6)-dimethylallyltransferase MiaA n=1 Tax=Konateibacter massiliensis TaxID=2002841 RepID=UPI000C15C8C3|nr:tRNA (adenosine(37)-N6)-dimethylallyltransferase MiaA [Konateibacter massiliensis]
MKKNLIILTGPTAVGKTELSIRLAKAVGGEIISADSMQVYKYMDIGSAKITKEEMDGVKHYLIDEFEPEEEFNVVKFKSYTKRYIQEIYDKGKIPILVGGTGFYIQAVLNDIDFTETKEETAYRTELEELAQEKGAEYLHDMLKQVDEASAEQIHFNNVKRVIRALEFYKLTGQKISEHNEEQRSKEAAYNFAYFVLNDDRKVLYERIDKRIDIMLEKGLLDEVTFLREKGYTKNMVSMQGLGYKELLSYLDGEISLEEAVYILKRDTRHFAKRQITWFKRESEVTWLNLPEFDYDKGKVLDKMLAVLKEKKMK